MLVAYCFDNIMFIVSDVLAELRRTRKMDQAFKLHGNNLISIYLYSNIE